MKWRFIDIANKIRRSNIIGVPGRDRGRTKERIFDHEVIESFPNSFANS